MNCTRWVSSCRQTQSRKSVGSTPSSRSTWTMLGATSSSRPAGSWNGSNWPSTREPRKPSSSPTSAPVTRDPIARPSGPGAPFFDEILSTSGVRMVAKPSALACTQPARSTTRTGAVRSPALRPVKSRTRPVDLSASARSSATAASAWAREISGPSPANRDPIRTARSQSIIAVGPVGSGRGSGCSLMREPYAATPSPAEELFAPTCAFLRPNRALLRADPCVACGADPVSQRAIAAVTVSRSSGRHRGRRPCRRGWRGRRGCPRAGPCRRAARR